VPADSFDGLVTNTAIWDVLADAGVMAGQAQGRLFIGLSSGGSGGYRFRSAHDFTGQRAFVEIAQPPITEATLMGFALQALDRSQDRIEMVLSRGKVDLAIYGSGIRRSLGVLEFDRAAHRFFQIRVAGDDLLLETSTDAATWILHATAPAGAWIAQARIDLSGTATGSNAQDILAFDNFNTCPSD
jgi:hypothetical protein